MPKQIRNKVLFMNDDFGIYDDMGAKLDPETTAAYLLKVRTNKLNPQKPMRELLERCGSPVAMSFVPDAVVTPEERDKVRELGYILTPASHGMDAEGKEYVDGLSATMDFGEDGYFHGHPFGEYETRRRFATFYGVRKLADTLEYFARLTLLSTGDMRSKDVISMRLDNGSLLSIHFETTIPLLGYPFGGEWIREDIFKTIDFRGFQCDTPRKTENGLYLNCSVFLGGFGSELPKAEADRIRIAANHLLAAVYDAATGTSYTPNFESGLPDETNRGIYCRAIMNAAREGRLSGCPWCGRPVLRLTPSADRYCSKTHRNKYDNETKRREVMGWLADGMTIEDAFIANKRHGYNLTERQIKGMAKGIEGR